MVAAQRVVGRHGTPTCCSRIIIGESRRAATPTLFRKSKLQHVVAPHDECGKTRYDVSRRKKSFPGISDAEFSVLKLLWAEGPSTPADLQEKLSDAGTDWAYTTVQTLLHRMLKKGFVSRKRAGVTRIYRANVEHEELLAAHMGELADRLCEGTSTPLLLSLVRTKRFTKKELDRFRGILNEEAGARTSPPGAAKKGKGRRN